MSLSARYKENKLVIGNDLRNEIRADLINKLRASWGDENEATDWKLAATSCGNLLLNEVPDQLVFIEGLNYANDLSIIRDSPLVLNVPNKLVYSFHMYSW